MCSPSLPIIKSKNSLCTFPLKQILGKNPSTQNIEYEVIRILYQTKESKVYENYSNFNILTIIEIRNTFKDKINGHIYILNTPR